MCTVFLGLLWVFLAFSILGLGPALALTRGKRPVGFAIATAPVLGFMLTAVFGTWLTLLDIPVSRWAVPFFVVGTAVSLLCLVYRLPVLQAPLSPAERRT